MPDADPAESSALLVTSPWRWWRAQMPVCDSWAYFDHAAVAPLPGPTADRIHDFARQAATRGDVDWLQWSGEVEQLRASAAGWLGAQSEEIAMIPNTSYGINIVAEGLDWQAGDNVVLPAGEFPSNLFPWLQQRDRGIEVRIVGEEQDPPDLERIAGAIDARTRLVAASWVGYANGYRLDVDRLVDLAHRRGALVFLDAIQGLGVFPLDLARTRVDFMAADGHKWMLGPEGAGVAFVRHEHLSRLRCRTIGWNSVKNAHLFGGAEFNLRDSAARYEAGSANMVGLLAMHRSLKLFWDVIAEHGPEAIGERVLELVEQADAALSAAGAQTRLPAQAENRSGILSFTIPDVDPAAFRKQALQAGVVVSCRGGGVRASIHAYNNAADIEKLANEVRTAIRSNEEATR
ncbi:aminotransferase class V-fold PLP-dependent enzyme [Roseimaritima ulvae]|uniref:Cysteine desulfurase n=1 Tax=Roseimaritima ulvae TaxID=980254 RepID=A0A5B9R7F4_9BACT|nr:aminotransferase class V-fold PLP-dependent enzyme [Roseimaritima ulvae]QEG42363.1 Cysteine desulfurase [Roseimaritima ulvae]